MEKINLTDREKNILTIMNDAPEKDFIKFARKFVDYPETEIKSIMNNLIKQGFIEILNLSSDEKVKKNYYFYTDKVISDLLNDDIRYEKDYGNYYQENKEKLNKVKKYKEFLNNPDKKAINIDWR